MSDALQILLAEDSAINRKLLTRFIQKIGHSVTTATNGREAVELWRHNPYDIILMDINMPIMDGLEATKEIRRLEEGRRIVIIALTASSSDEDRKMCEQAGMDSLITKPVSLTELRTLCARYSK